MEKTMKTVLAALAGALLGANFVTPAMATDKACLQNNRIWGWPGH